MCSARAHSRRPKLAFAEWNCANLRHKEMSAEWPPGRTQYRMLDALVSASFLNVMQRQSATVGLANLAQTINVVGARGGVGVTDPEGDDGEVGARLQQVHDAAV